MSILVSIENLLSGDFIEGTRMEFKKDWNPKRVMRTVCAFANDFENEGSGYIVIGVDEKDGKPIRPVEGFDPNKYESVQKDLIGYCNLIQPSYVPRLSLEEIDNKHVLVIWVPSGSNRPYKVPDDILAKHKTYNYRIRQFSSSVIPNSEQEAELIQLTAKIPFDDRVNTNASLNDLSFSLMREHLSKTDSKLYGESASMSVTELADKMNLCQGAQEHLFPKNVGLLMFSDKTKDYFSGAHIDVVEFPEGIGAKEFREKTFEGTIQKQLTDVLSYLKTNIIKSKVLKSEDKEESVKIYNYPYAAVEEALSNAVYHRNYEMLDPIEVRILQESIEIISYNGVDPSLKQSDFEKGVIRARRYRNRRIGEFLKELRLTEGRGTGIPTIIRSLNTNGSEKPKFDTDEPQRSHFLIEIPIHKDFVDNLLEGSGTPQVTHQDTHQVFDQQQPYYQSVNQNTEQGTEQDAEQGTPQVIKMLKLMSGEMSRQQIQNKLDLSDKKNFNKNYLQPAINEGLVEMTMPDKPKSSKQKYKLTAKGEKLKNS